MATFTETWTGSNGAEWPAVWVTSNSTGAGTIDVQSGEGRMSTATANYNVCRAVLSADVWNDTDGAAVVYFRVPSGGKPQINLCLRADGGWGLTDVPSNGYIAQANMAGDNFFLLKAVSGTVTQLGATQSFAYTVGATYAMRLETDGSTIRVKVWAASGSEPGWAIEETDTSLPGSGRLQLSMRNLTGGDSREVRFDDLTVATLGEEVEEAPAEAAAGSAAANDAAVSLTKAVAATAAAGSAVGFDGTVLVTGVANPTGLVAAASAAAADASVALPAITVSGSGTGAAHFDNDGTVTETVEFYDGHRITVTGHDATVSISPDTQASAGRGQATGQAHGPTVDVVEPGLAGAFTATVTAMGWNASTNVTIVRYRFTPPTAEQGGMYLPYDQRRGRRLFAQARNVPRGVTVVKRAGVYQTVDQGPDVAFLDTCEEVYLGGHSYEVNEATAQALVAAGFEVGGYP